MRENLKKKNLDKWISLNLVFSDVKNFKFNFIATLKDKKSVVINNIFIKFKFMKIKY